MSTVKPTAYLLLTLVSGACLAVLSAISGFPAGWIGAIILIGWAIGAARRWREAPEKRPVEPSPPERILWLRLVSTGLILGHATAALLLLGEDLRLGSGNTLAIDSWTLLAALPIVALIFRRDRSQRDERHEAISAQGVRTGYAALAALLVMLLGYLAFAPFEARAPLTHFVLANLLVALLLASYAIALLTQLVLYGRDRVAYEPDDDFR